MNAIVNIHEAKTHFSKLIERAHSGEEIVVAKAGKPYARLVPLEVAQKPQRKPGRLKGKLANISDSVWFDPLPDDELDAWEGKYSNIL
jgi:prevent-host-death family protein